MLTVPQEEERIALLHALAVLDSPPEPFFDAICRLVASAIDVPIVLVSFVDTDRLWFKSGIGTEKLETPRTGTFCSWCIAQEAPLLVSDALTDARFAHNPYVTGYPGIRSYAGAIIRSSHGLALGSLCVLDTQPRQFEAADIERLNDAAQMVSHEMQHREALLTLNRPLASEVAQVLDGEARFRSVFEGAAIGIALIGLDGQWMDVNDALCNIVSYSRKELKQLTFQDITHPEDLDKDLRLLDQLAKGDADRYTIEKRYIRKDGAIVWINLTVAVRRSPTGTPLYYISIVDDIQQRVEAQQALLALQQTLEQRVESRTRELQHAIDQLKLVTDNVPALVAYFDADLRYRYANEAYRSMLGKDPQALIGHPLAEVAGSARAEEIKVKLSASKNEQRTTLEMSQPLPDGSMGYNSVTFIPNIIDDEIVGYYSLAHDITERHAREMAREREALQDVLTGLPNRRAFQEALTQAIARANGRSGSMAVLFIDLDGFKGINDTLGHECGDLVLKETALRLAAQLQSTDIAARLAGDEFVLIVEGDLTAQEIEALARKLLVAIGAPMQIGNHEITASASIGIAIYRSAGGKTPEGLLHAADIGMYDAKRAGKNQYRFGPSYDAIPI